MIHYHGGPITPVPAALALWQRRHACVSLAYPEQIPLAFEIAQSVMVDTGGYTLWTQGLPLDLPKVAGEIRKWEKHPGYDFHIGPDDPGGDDHANDLMLARWFQLGMMSLDGSMVPVWHLHESFDRLARLCHTYRRVALGSSGEWATVGTDSWWQRMGLAMDAICDDEGRPPCKLHGLRMLDPTIFSQLPLASADSTNVAQNIGIDQKWRHAYAPVTKMTRALVIADRIEYHASAPRWLRTFGVQKNFDLVG